MNATITISPHIRAWRWLALAVGLLGAAACLWGLFGLGDRTHFFRAYLFAWTVCLSWAAGGLSLLMLHNATGGEWGSVLRIVSLRAALTLPLLALLFIPVLLGLPELYPWASAGTVAGSDVLRHRAPYLNVSFFELRAAGYFILWSALAIVLAFWQRRFAATGDARIRGRIRGLSAAGLILYLLTMTNAGIDWLMSRDTPLYSTAFGFVVTLGQTLSAAAFALVIAGALPVRGQRRSALASATSRGILNDVGNVLLTLVILWTYVSFMEFLVVWMGNSREDNTWFIQRGMGQPSPWRWIGLALILFHFFIPFYVLLFRASKQYIPALVAMAWVLLLADVINVYWQVAASGPHPGPVFDPHWLDVAALAGVGGIWLACFLWILPTEWQPMALPVHPFEVAEVAHE